MMTKEQAIDELKNFWGTEHYYKGFMGVKYTDGVQFFYNNVSNWIISDASVIVKMQKKVKAEEFVSITATIKDNKADIKYDDGNGNVLFTQHYNLTNLEDHEFRFYYTDGILMLVSEY